MRRRIAFVAVALGIAAVLTIVLLPDGGVLAFVGRWFRSDPRASSEAARDAGADERLEADLHERARLHGLPGFDAAPDGRGRIVGEVRLHAPDGAARPLPGVAVEAMAVVRGHTSRLAAETGADGRFAFDDAPAAVDWAVVVRRPPYRETVLRGVRVAAGETADVGVVLLGAPTTLEGMAVDAAGRPVPGVAVQVLRDAARKGSLDVQQALFDLNGYSAPLASAQGDREGRFALEGLSPGRYVLRVSAPGFATSFREDVLVTADERSGAVRVVLDPGSGWYGRVLDEEGKGVGGARVVAVALPGGDMSRLDKVETTSDVDGAYRLDTLVSGLRYFVEAWADGYSPTGRILTPTGTRELDLQVVRAGRIEGLIRDAATGAGIPGARVTAIAGTMNTLSPLSAVADDAGWYAFPAVSPGPVFLFSARAAGYSPENLDVKTLGGRKVVAGESLRIDLDLKAGGTVRGRVAATDGTPIPYATVGLFDPHRKWEGEATALTDVQGGYELGGLHPATYDLRVTAAGYAPVVDENEAKVVVPADGSVVVKDVTVAKGGTLHGTLQAPDGSAAGGARISLVASAEPAKTRVRDLATIADPQGAWRLAGVPAGADVQVAAEHDDYARTLSAPLRVALGEDREVALAMRAGAKVPGRVEDARQRPVAGARVRWGRVLPGQEGRAADAFRADELLGTRVIRTDDGGNFVLDRLEGGRYVVRIEKEGYSDWYRSDLEVADDETRPLLVVTLQGSLSIRGKVVDAETGAAIAECWVYAKEQEAVEQSPDPGKVKALVTAQSAADGTYLLEGLPPGRYEVAAWFAIGYLGAAQKDPDATRSDVAAGSTAVDFRLKPEPPPAR